MFYIKVIIIILLCVILYPVLDNVEGIHFEAPYLYKHYDNNDIQIIPDKKILVKNGKSVSYATQLNKPSAKKISKNKFLTKQVLIRNNIPTANYYHWNPSKSFAQNVNDIQYKLNFPLVIKPNSLERGMGVFTNIQNVNQLTKLLNKVLKMTNDIIIEEYIEENSYRILVFNNSVITAYQIMKPEITGDGIHTVQFLINNLLKTSSEPIDKDQIDYTHINKQGYSLTSILPKNKRIVITNTANGSIGTAFPNKIDLNKIHPHNKEMFKKVNRVMGLNLNGIDYITHDLMIPYYKYGYIIETNSTPGIEFHNDIDPDSMDRWVKLIKF